jgi:hypothetical protein
MRSAFSESGVPSLNEGSTASVSGGTSGLPRRATLVSKAYACGTPTMCVWAKCVDMQSTAMFRIGTLWPTNAGAYTYGTRLKCEDRGARGPCVRDRDGETETEPPCFSCFFISVTQKSNCMTKRKEAKRSIPTQAATNCSSTRKREVNSYV